MRLKWDQPSEKIFETGIEKGVLYLLDSDGSYPAGVPWNGLTGVDENPSGGEPTKIYADNAVYGALYSAEEFGFTIKAYTYPDEFEECDGSKEIVPGVIVGQQGRKPFGFSYRTLISNDTNGNKHGYKIHLVYGCKASPSGKSFTTVNNSPSGNEMSWTVTTTPVGVEEEGFEQTSTIVIDSTKIDSAKLALLEKALYGGDQESEVAHLPLPDEVFALIK